MTSEHAISYEELEKRRQKVAERRKPSTPQPVLETESEAMQAINEIFNPSLKIPVSTGPYRPPEEWNTDDFDAERDLDIKKLAELKEVFLLFDTDCDGLISKDDLRFTFGALGSEASEDLLEEMLKEAKDPLDLDAFVQLMSFRTVELDPEDVLLEAWSKWDLYGTGKIEERNCLDYVEIFPYLREPVVENTTLPEFIMCNLTQASSIKSARIAADDNIIIITTNTNITTNASVMNRAQSEANVGSIPIVRSDAGSTFTTTLMSIHDLRPYEFIYSSGKVFAMRLRFNGKAQLTPGVRQKIDNWSLNVTAEYRFLKKSYFKNDGRLIAGTFCDYYFFANPDETPQSLEIWKYFHSPRFPAKYPAHIKCSYKFIGRPETRVELIFEELDIPRDDNSCNLDKVTMFDAESPNMNAVIDVLCGNSSTGSRYILSTGPDLLIEFNSSSNKTAKGFRGKFKFIQNNEIMEIQKTKKATDIPFVADMYSGQGVVGDGKSGNEIELAGVEGSAVDNVAASKQLQQNLIAFHIMDNTKVVKGFNGGKQEFVVDHHHQSKVTSKLFHGDSIIANKTFPSFKCF